MDNKHCRFCGKELKHSMVDLGLSPISNEYVEEENIDMGQYYYPLHVMVCEHCFLAQTIEYKAPEQIFTNYKYLSSYSKSWLEHCHSYVEMIVKRLRLTKDSFVYEVASNDGYLLQYFKEYGIPACGIEPAENVAEVAKKKGIDVEVEFWGKETAAAICRKRGKADLIIGNNVLAHVPDINSFVEGLGIALEEKGTITMEFPHLLKLMELNQFDTIYQEHFSYFSLACVKRIFELHNLQVYDVEELPTHGGSLRIFAAHSAHSGVVESEAVKKVLEEEKAYRLDHIEIYDKFYKKVEKIKRDSCALLIELKNQGKSIAGFGAAAKGNTFLNYCGIGREYIDFVADSSPAKQGMYLPGTRIPIVPPEMIEEKKPDYIIFLPWNLKEELTKLLDFTRKWGCKFITFIPEKNIF